MATKKNVTTRIEVVGTQDLANSQNLEPDLDPINEIIDTALEGMRLWDRYQASNTALEFAKKYFAADFFEKELNTRRMTANETVEYAQRLVLADRDLTRDEFDFVIRFAVAHLKRQRGLSREVRHFVIEVLTERRTRPNTKSVGKQQNKERDYRLWRTTKSIADRYGLPLYSTSEPHSGTTAAQIVADATGCSVDVVTTAYKKLSREFGDWG
jgi:hypothetical protein